jgi:hypothetical protein
MVDAETLQQCSARAKNKDVVEVLRKLFEYVIDTLGKRIDDLRADDGKALSFFSKGREILTINVTRKNLRIYIHPSARAFFDPKAKFRVEKFRFWDGSFQKTTGKYRAMSVWISEKQYLPGVKKILTHIPTTDEGK